MVKERKLKKWVVNVLAGINFTSLILMGSETEDLSTFIIGHIIFAVIFIISGIILLRNMNK